MHTEGRLLFRGPLCIWSHRSYNFWQLLLSYFFVAHSVYGHRSHNFWQLLLSYFFVAHPVYGHIGVVTSCSCC